MPPRKKQRTDDAARSVAVVSRRTTRASAKASQGGGIVAADKRVVLKGKEETKTAVPDTLKRVVRKGRLQNLPDLPLDVQLEIYNHLDLGDLFNLARTCKRFRAFFLDPKLEKTLWVPARLNTPGIPERPPFMSEYLFAHLLYSPHCHNCGASNIRKVVHGCFVRLCAACLAERTVWFSDASMEARKIDGSGTLSSRFFDSRVISTYFPVQGRFQRPYDPKCNRLLRHHVDRIFKQYKALPTPVTTEALRALVVQVATDYRTRLPYAHAIHFWLEEQEHERKDNLGGARQQRFDAILIRSRDDGWGEDLKFMGAEGIKAMSKMPVVRQSSKLTEGAWQKVLVALDGLLKDTREKRLNKEYRKVLRARFKVLEEAIVAHYVTLPRTARMDCRPQDIDFAFTPECRAILDVPLSETVTADQFAPILPALARKWDADRRKELTKYLVPHLGEIAADVDPLELAIAFFTFSTRISCSGPIRTMRYPAILKHRCFRGDGDCFRSLRIRPALDHFKDDLYTRTAKTLHCGMDYESEILESSYDTLGTRIPFNIDALDERWRARDVVSRMRRIVSAVGLDPARATFEDLERCDVWLRCVICETQEPHNAICARSWSSAYEHDLYHITSIYCMWSKKGIPEWRRADDEDMIKVRAVKEAESAKTRSGYLRWSCALCPDFNAHAEAMATHLKQTHDIEDFCQARRDDIVYLHPSANPSKAFSNSICLRDRIKPQAAEGGNTQP